MKPLKKILGGLAALVLLLVLVAFAFPRNYRVERSIMIQTKPDAVLGQVADLRAWKNWGPWHERDPQMKLSYSAVSTGPGAWAAWESKTEGDGKMTITEQSPAKLTYRLEFPDMGMESVGTMELQAQAGATKVVWISTGDLGMNPLNRWFGLFLDKMIGPDFERGLVKMKRQLEK